VVGLAIDYDNNWNDQEKDQHYKGTYILDFINVKYAYRDNEILIEINKNIYNQF
jgi:hypothetical protein